MLLFFTSYSPPPIVPFSAPLYSRIPWKNCPYFLSSYSPLNPLHSTLWIKPLHWNSIVQGLQLLPLPSVNTPLSATWPRQTSLITPSFLKHCLFDFRDATPCWFSFHLIPPHQVLLLSLFVLAPRHLNLLLKGPVLKSQSLSDFTQSQGSKYLLHANDYHMYISITTSPLNFWLLIQLYTYSSSPHNV